MAETPRQIDTLPAPQTEVVRVPPTPEARVTAVGVTPAQDAVARAALSAREGQSDIASVTATATVEMSSVDALVVPSTTPEQLEKDIQQTIAEHPEYTALLRARVESYREPVDVENKAAKEQYDGQMMRLGMLYDARLAMLTAERLAGQQPDSALIRTTLDTVSREIAASQPVELAAIAAMDGVGNRISLRDFDGYYAQPLEARIPMGARLAPELIGVGGVTELYASLNQQGFPLGSLDQLTDTQIVAFRTTLTTHLASQLSLYARSTPTAAEAEAMITELTQYYTLFAGPAGSKIAPQLITDVWSDVQKKASPELVSLLAGTKAQTKLDRLLNREDAARSRATDRMAAGREAGITPLTEAFNELQQADTQAQFDATHNPQEAGLRKNWNLMGVAKVLGLGWAGINILINVVKHAGNGDTINLLTNPAFLASLGIIGGVWYDGHRLTPEANRAATLEKDLPPLVKQIADENPSLVPFLRAVDEDMLVKSDVFGLRERLQRGETTLPAEAWTRLPHWAELQKEYKLPDPATLTSADREALFRALAMSQAAGVVPRSIRDFPRQTR